MFPIPTIEQAVIAAARRGEQDRGAKVRQPPLLHGWGSITNADDAADGKYVLTMQQWDQTENGGDGGLVSAPYGPQEQDAYELNLGTTHAVNDIVYFREVRDKDGTLKRIFEVAPNGVFWYKATQNWSEATGGAAWDNWRVYANPEDQPGGVVDAGTTDTVYIPQSDFLHPAIVENQEFACVKRAGNIFAVSAGIYDARIHTIRLWAEHDTGVPDNIPPGWQLCDGENDPQGNPVPNLKGKFVVGVDSGDADWNLVAETGGNKTHTHDAHPVFSHQHTENDTSGGVQVAADGGPLVAYLCATDEEVDSRDLSHTSPNHCPPFYALAYIIRVDNSVAWV